MDKKQKTLTIESSKISVFLSVLSTGVEPVAPSLGNLCSILLSYESGLSFMTDTNI